LRRKIDSSDKNIKVAVNDIRAAFRDLEATLGQATVNALIQHLELFNLRLESDRKEYALAELEFVIERIFGEASPLILQKILKSLNQVNK
jgi:hypothetical protein